MLQAQNLSIIFGSRTLFDNVSFTIQPRDRIGLVGRNGVGKSTLLKTINGEISPQEGNITKPGGYTIGFLKQEIRGQNEPTVWLEAQTAFREINVLQEELDQIQHQLETRTDYDSEAYMNLSQLFCDLNDRLIHLDVDDKDKKTELVLLGLGYKREDFEKAPATFSGGWAMRLELAKLLLQNPDLLMLDEPTNHLDIESIIWLEEFFQKYEGAIILVSHDKTFLDNVCNKTIELELGKMYEYKANYSKYLILKEERREKQLQTFKNQQDQIKQIERNIERFKAKASKASMAQSLVKKLDRMDIVEVEQDDVRTMRFQFPMGQQSGKVVVTAKNLAKSYGDKNVFHDVNLEIERGDKVAFIGKNGMGKTTMAKIIAKEIDYNAGELTIGHNVNIAFFAQHHAEQLPKELTILQYMEDTAPNEIRAQVRNILGAFMFSGDDATKKISVLSGGERARVCLAHLLLHPSNVLILDEPTNHLDLRAKDVLKDAISKYPGTVIVVSHDRDFLVGMTNKVFEFNDGIVQEFVGDVNDFFEERRLSNFREVELSPQTTANNTQKKEEVKTVAPPQDKQLKNKIAKLEEAIAIKEFDIKKLEEKIELLSEAGKYEEDIVLQLGEEKKALEKLMLEWEGLQQ
ncbi:MAG TPA: ABC-F family ATP-binding cassette domain-containing protein [Chitinophagales bacterium]|nr:ABC-F family ATP-binding cassette domain-containing protein [Chitinophagales bacterium]HQO89263.1 ABC-F family ATP-binding cassette domain-containing protein [Chitinophagales bacterium]